METLGIIVIVTIVVMVVRLVVLSKYNNQNNDLLRNKNLILIETIKQMNKKYVTLKLIEELNELSTILLQQHNKPHKDFLNEISMEFGDVHTGWKCLKMRVN